MKTLLDRLRGLLFPAFPGGREGIGLFFLRLIIGAGITVHGWGKITDIPGFAAEFHLPFPLAALAALVQVGGGIFLVLGLLTPLAALGVAGTMVVATASNILGGDPFVNPKGHSWDNSALYLSGALAAGLLGAGAYSLDAILWKPTGLTPSAESGVGATNRVLTR